MIREFKLGGKCRKKLRIIAINIYNIVYELMTIKKLT